MVSSKPYLFRAIYEWLLDSNCTPHVVVDATIEGVIVPLEYVADGQIVLNISPSAIDGFVVSNADLQFSARFGGRPYSVFVPMCAIRGIYARENGQGMVFEDMEEDVDPPDGPEARTEKKPSLKLVK